MLIYEKPGCVRVEYQPARNLILLDWNTFAIQLAELQDLHEKALAAVHQYRCYYYVAETSRVRTVFGQEHLRWWGEVWVPKLAQSGLLGIVTVVPASALAKLSTRSWQAEVTEGIEGITMKNVQSLAEAYAAVREMQQAKRRG